MPKTLTLSSPVFSTNNLNGTRHVEWYLLDTHGNGYLISWLEKAYDTGRPECMAFRAKANAMGSCTVLSWTEQAVSYEPDAVLALYEVLQRLEEHFDYRYVNGGDIASLKPGEVVADAQ